jgi:hypothetical protein
VSFRVQKAVSECLNKLKRFYMRKSGFFKVHAVSLVIAFASFLSSPVHAFGLSDLDPTNPDSAVRDAATEIDPTNPDSAVRDAATEIDPTNPDAFVNQGVAGEVNPVNPDSAINDGLTEVDPTNPDSAFREGLTELDPTDPDSAVGEVVDKANPVSAVGKSANEQLATAGQNFQEGFIEPTKQLIFLAGGGILLLMMVSTLLSKLKGKKSA